MENKKITKLKLLVLDDDVKTLNTIKNLLARISFVEVVLSETSSLRAYDYLQNNGVDVLLSDIVMDDLDGIDLVKSLTNRPEVIYTTSYDEKAMLSYGIKVRYCLPKPVSFLALQEALNEIYEQHKKGIDDLNKDSLILEVTVTENKELDIKRKYMMRFKFEEIAVFCSKANYVEMYLTDERKYTFRSTLKELEARLPVHRFQKVHRGFIINVDHCTKLDLKSEPKIIYMIGCPQGVPLGEHGVMIAERIFGLESGDFPTSNRIDVS